MTALSIQAPFPIITDIDGQPLEDGYIWIGVANLPPIGNPITVYWDAALTQPAALPVRTLGGYPMNSGTPGRLYVNSDYSILVQNKNGSTVYSASAATERLSGVVIEVDATDVSFIQAGAGAVTRTAQSKMRDVVSAKDFGAVGDGVTDDTAELLAAFTYAMANALTLDLEDGNYLVSGPITPGSVQASVSLHIRCKGAVTITVAAGATAFTNLIYCHSTAANNGSITGGSLYINLNNRCASGITVRHDAASQSGVVNFEAPVTVVNGRQNDATAITGNQGILIYGDYAIVKLMQPKVVGITRTNPAAGDCKGIAIAAFSGEVTLFQPHTENILTGAATVDADGIAIFGKSIGGVYAKRAGRAVVHEPVFIDCQGRSFKSQCSDVTIFRPRVKRQNVVSIALGHDFDFQFGNGLVIEPDFEYRLNGGTSPLGASFRPFAFQQLLDDEKMQAKVVGGVMRTEVAMLNFGYVFQQPTAQDAITEIDGLQVIAFGALTTTVFTRAFIEFDASAVEAQAGKTRLVVRNTNMPVVCPVLGYTLYGGTSLATKLSWEVRDNTTTLATASQTRPIYNISGSAILAFERFLLCNNSGYRDLLIDAGFTFSFATLEPGCIFTMNIATAVVTNPPAWGVTGFALIECLSIALATNGRNLRVTKDGGNAVNTVFASDTSGAAWGTIK